MSPRLLLALAAVALLGVVSAAAWSLTRPPVEQEVPPIRIESPAPLRHEEREEGPTGERPSSSTREKAPDRHSR
jgi:hypothetical protein